MKNKQGVRNPPSQEEGLKALNIYLELEDKNKLDKDSLRTLIKYLLEILHKKVPGNSVEVRIPPFAAIQIIEGTTHRRGTPPAVIEINPEIFIQISLGEITWEKALTQGLIQASGQRTDLTEHFPLVDSK
ncbi:MAG: sterol carrier family protein [Candidatus Nanopelagicales bacterium]